MKFIRGRLGGFLEVGHTKIIKKFMIIIFVAGRFLLSRGFSFYRLWDDAGHSQQSNDDEDAAACGIYTWSVVM